MFNMVLVTGGAGFIGSNFIHYLLAREPKTQVVNLDLLTYAGNENNLAGLTGADRYTLVRGDINDRELVSQLFHEYQIDTVVHFAAETHVDRSIDGPAQFIQTNIVGTFNLLDAARQFWINEKALPVEQVHFHHVSTDEVFGTLLPEEPAFSEETKYAPRSPYAASKASSDHLVRAYFTTYGLPVTITNCSNNYGPYQFPEKLIPLIILNALNGKPLPVYGDGKQIRDWLYVEDHCEAIYEVIRAGRVGETYNVGGNNQPANIEIVRQICAIMDDYLPESPYRPHANLIQYVKDRPGHDRRYDIDIEKIHTELNWSPRESLESGLKKTVRWYLDHMDWVEGATQTKDYQNWVNKNYSSRGA
jgi:dTDP-glucose 4,6-dehydratase